MTSQRIWAGIGKLALVVTVLGGLQMLWTALSTRDVDLRFDGYYSNLELPYSQLRPGSRLSELGASEILQTYLEQERGLQRPGISQLAKRSSSFELAAHGICGK